jgi:ribonucrease Y
MTVTIVLSAVIALAAGIALGFFMRKIIAEGQIASAKTYSSQIIDNAKKEASSLVKEAELEARDKMLKAQADFDSRTKEERRDLQNLENRLRQREESIDKRVEVVEKKEKDTTAKNTQLSELDKKLKTHEEELSKSIGEQRKKLEAISGLSAEAAKNELINSMGDDAKKESLNMIKRVEEEAKENAEKKAREIITTAIQRVAADHTSEISVSVVPLPNEEMKGP